MTGRFNHQGVFARGRDVVAEANLSACLRGARSDRSTIFAQLEGHTGEWPARI